MLALVRFPTAAHPATMNPDIMRNLALIYIPLSSGLSVAAVLTWFLFRIDKDAHDLNLAAIAARKTAELA